MQTIDAELQPTTSGYRHSHTHSGKAKAYDEHNLFRYRSFLWEKERAVLGDVVHRYFSGQKVDCLDFACGTGRILEFLETVTMSTTGVDVSEDMLASARSKLNRTRLARGDITREPLFNEREFNLITAFRFFLNAEESLRIEAMRELARLLAPGGLLVFNNHMNRFSAAGCWARTSTWRGRGQSRTWRIKDMKQLVNDAGLRVVEIHHAGVLPGWERYMLLPVSWYRAIENVTSRVAALRHIAQDIVFVCRRKD